MSEGYSKRYAGKVAVITGGAAGLGRALALGYGQEGAHLVLADVNEDGLAETAAALDAIGATCSTHRVDLSSEAEIHRFAAEVIALHPRIDLLYNNAGLAYGEISRSFEQLGMDKWLFYFAINTVAPLLLATALRAPLAAAPGVIINQSSMASYVPATAYGVTKSALNAMNYGMAQLFGRDGVRVNAIAPGLMETPANRAAIPDEHYAAIQDRQLLKLHGGPDDIVRLALFLASDEARFITNEIVHCDAGHPLRGWRG